MTAAPTRSRSRLRAPRRRTCPATPPFSDPTAPAVASCRRPQRDYLNSDIIPGLSIQVTLLFILVTPVQFGYGWPFFKKAYKALKAGAANMDVLVVMGTSVAYFYSVFFTILSIHSAGRVGCAPPRVAPSSRPLAPMPPPHRPRPRRPSPAARPTATPLGSLSVASR